MDANLDPSSQATILIKLKCGRKAHLRKDAFEQHRIDDFVQADAE